MPENIYKVCEWKLFTLTQFYTVNIYAFTFTQNNIGKNPPVFYTMIFACLVHDNPFACPWVPLMGEYIPKLRDQTWYGLIVSPLFWGFTLHNKH
jgi:hypothetical protein